MYIGIDPGLHGAIAALDESGGILWIHDMPAIEIAVNKKPRLRVNTHGIAALIKPIAKTIRMAFIERVGGITGQSASAAFTFGHACGLPEGVLVALDVPVAFAAPQTWKRASGLPKNKGAARQRAMQVWPKDAALFSRAKDDGRAEAALLARFGIMHKL